MTVDAATAAAAVLGLGLAAGCGAVLLGSAGRAGRRWALAAAGDDRVLADGEGRALRRRIVRVHRGTAVATWWRVAWRLPLRLVAVPLAGLGLVLARQPPVAVPGVGPGVPGPVLAAAGVVCLALPLITAVTLRVMAAAPVGSRPPARRRVLAAFLPLPAPRLVGAARREAARIRLGELADARFLADEGVRHEREQAFHGVVRYRAEQLLPAALELGPVEIRGRVLAVLAALRPGLRGFRDPMLDLHDTMAQVDELLAGCTAPDAERWTALLRLVGRAGGEDALRRLVPQPGDVLDAVSPPDAAWSEDVDAAWPEDVDAARPEDVEQAVPGVDLPSGAGAYPDSGPEPVVIDLRSEGAPA